VNYCTDYIIYLYILCNFICGSSDVIIRTFSQTVFVPAAVFCHLSNILEVTTKVNKCNKRHTFNIKISLSFFQHNVQIHSNIYRYPICQKVSVCRIKERCWLLPWLSKPLTNGWFRLRIGSEFLPTRPSLSLLDPKVLVIRINSRLYGRCSNTSNPVCR